MSTLSLVLLVAAAMLLVLAVVLVSVGALRSRNAAQTPGHAGSVYVVMGSALAALALLPVGLLIATRSG